MHSKVPTKIFLVIISILGTFSFPFLAIFVILPFWLLRKFATFTAQWNPDLYKELSVDSSLTAVDNLYSAPICSLVTIINIKGPLPYTQFQDRIAALVESDMFPELRCYLFRWRAIFFWKRCNSNFSLDNHLSKSDISNPIEFQAYTESLVTKPFVSGQPLWEMIAFPSYAAEETSSALVIRLHHSLCDAGGLVCLIKGIEDPNTDIKDALTQLKAKYKTQSMAPMGGLCYYLKLFLLTPTSTLFTILNSYNSNEWNIPDSKRTGDNVYYTGVLELDWVKGIAKKMSIRFTTLLAEAITVAIQSTMEDQGIKIHNDVTMLMILPRPGHPGTLSNYAFGVPIVAPISVTDRKTRLKFISNEFKKWRSPLAVGMMVFCSSFAMFQGVVNTWVKGVVVGGHFGTLILSNFMFYPRIGTLFGSEMAQLNMLVGLQERSNSLFLGMGGYNGKLRLSVTADRAIFSDKITAQRFVDLIIQEVDKLDKEANNNFVEKVCN